MNLSRLIIALSLLAFLTGCSGTGNAYAPTEEVIKNADYGTKPENYKNTIEAYIRPKLLDPEAGQFTNYSMPKKDWLANFEGFDNVKFFGWLVCVDVNGKNLYGAYIGAKTNFFIFRGEDITYHQEGDTTKLVSFTYNYPIQCKY